MDGDDKENYIAEQTTVVDRSPSYQENIDKAQLKRKISRQKIVPRSLFNNSAMSVLASSQSNFRREDQLTPTEMIQNTARVPEALFRKEFNNP